MAGREGVQGYIAEAEYRRGASQTVARQRDAFRRCFPLHSSTPSLTKQPTIFMASQSEEAAPNCPSCHHMVITTAGAVRTICPFCGALLQPNKPPSRPSTEPALVRLPRVPSSRSGIGGGIARFLASLRGSRSRQGKSHARRHSTDGGTASDDEIYFDQEEAASSAGMRKSGSVQALPPISSGHATRALTSRGLVRVRPFQTPPQSSSVSSPAADAPNKLICDAPSLEREMAAAEGSGSWDAVAHFYVSTFNSFVDMNVVFHLPHRRRAPPTAGGSRGASDSETDLEFVAAAWTSLLRLPSDLQKSVLKAVINCLLSDQRNADVALMKPVCRDDLRAYLILLQVNFLFTFSFRCSRQECW